MPEEFSRTTARKAIALPGGGTVSVPVITKISFIDPSDRYQETEYTIDNSSNSSRTVHVDEIENSEGDTLSVERIDEWPVIDSTDRGQETIITLDNVTGAQDNPIHFSTHERTHVVRYYADPNNKDDEGVWIDVELIDELRVQDPTDRGQETYLTLNWNDEQADPSDPDISDPGTIDPPWRLDPFSNIIGFQSTERVPGEVWVSFAWNGPQFFTGKPPPNTWSTGFSVSGPVIKYFDFGHQELGWTTQQPTGVQVTGSPSFSTYGETWGEAVGYFAETGENSFNISINPEGGPEEIRAETVTRTGVTCSWTNREDTSYPMALNWSIWTADLGTSGAAMAVIYSFRAPNP